MLDHCWNCIHMTLPDDGKPLRESTLFTCDTAWREQLRLGDLVRGFYAGCKCFVPRPMEQLVAERLSGRWDIRNILCG